MNDHGRCPYRTETSGFSLSSKLTIKDCGYHKCAHADFGEETLAPPGLCPDAYYAAYPMLLAQLYDAKFQGSGPFPTPMAVRCPHTAAPSTIRIGMRDKLLKPLWNLAELVFRILRSPKDAIDKIVTVAVAERSGECDLPPSAALEVTVPDLRQLCPASFFSLYPLLRLASHESAPAAAKRLNFICPDPATNVVYFHRERKEETQRPSLPPTCAVKPVKLRLSLENGEACSCADWRAQLPARVDTLLPTGTCSYLFNIAVPYLVTLNHGGYFKWRLDKNDVAAQCPYPAGGVEFDAVRLDGDVNRLGIRITTVRGHCAAGHQAGQLVDFETSRHVCPHLFPRLFPHMLEITHGLANHAVVACPFPGNASRYRLERCDD